MCLCCTYQALQYFFSVVIFICLFHILYFSEESVVDLDTDLPRRRLVADEQTGVDGVTSGIHGVLFSFHLGFFFAEEGCLRLYSMFAQCLYTFILFCKEPSALKQSLFSKNKLKLPVKLKFKCTHADLSSVLNAESQ